MAGDIRTHTGTAKRPDAYKFDLANLTRRVLTPERRARLAFDAHQLNSICTASLNSQ
jgi:hypothetical protein